MTPFPLETDPRFPSGPWVGFFTDKRMPGKHAMDLRLTFSAGRMLGDGRDWVGIFAIDGDYDVVSGACTFTKQYVGRHQVHYRGFNEGRGIWGTWEMTDQGLTFTGGFHIWPDGMPDPSVPVLTEEADVPQEVEEFEREPVPV